MSFNTIEFGVFVLIAFLVYWFILYENQHKNIFLLILNMIFYGWWDWRFLFLINISIIVDYYVGLLLDRNKNQSSRKFFLICSIIFNLGLLGVFKYYNFFIESFNSIFEYSSNEYRFSTINLILPIGISFYTFQTLSYTIDVYRKKIAPSNNFIEYAAYVSFFPQLIAGPIERAKNLLPQFKKKDYLNIQLQLTG